MAFKRSAMNTFKISGWKCLGFQTLSIPAVLFSDFQLGVVLLCSPRTPEVTLTNDLLEKFQDAIFFQDIQDSFHGVADMGLEPHQKIF